jgi:glutamate racemase
VPIIEEGFFEHELIDVALNEYLADPLLQNIESLVLGCTHYPIIQKSIANFYQNKIDIIDAAKIVANAVKTELSAQNMLASANPKHNFYVSDLTKGFAKGAQMFFGDNINLELKNIF